MSAAAQRCSLLVATDCSVVETPIMALMNLGVEVNHVFACNVSTHPRDSAKAATADLYVGGFLYQPCSTAAGPQQGFYDDWWRYASFWHVRAYLEQQKPRMFVLVSISSLVLMNGGEYYRATLEALGALKTYNVYSKFMDHTEHSATSHKRIYFIGFSKRHDDGSFTFLPLDPEEGQVMQGNLTPTCSTPARTNAFRAIRELPAVNVLERLFVQALPAAGLAARSTPTDCRAVGKIPAAPMASICPYDFLAELAVIEEVGAEEEEKEEEREEAPAIVEDVHHHETAAFISEPAAVQRFSLSVATDGSRMKTPLIALKNLGVEVKHVFPCDENIGANGTIMANYPPKGFFDDHTKRDNAKAATADLYVAGFLYQPFATAAGLQQGFYDARGRYLSFWHVRGYLEQQRPRMFVLGSISSLVLMNGGEYYRATLESLGALKTYNVHSKFMDTAEHGGPHSRQRIYFIGISKRHDDGSFCFPDPVTRPSIEMFLDPPVRRQVQGSVPPTHSTTARMNVCRTLKELSAVNVLERLFVRALPAAGLVPHGTLTDRWACGNTPTTLMAAGSRKPTAKFFPAKLGVVEEEHEEEEEKEEEEELAVIEEIHHDEVAAFISEPDSAAAIVQELWAGKVQTRGGTAGVIPSREDGVAAYRHDGDSTLRGPSSSLAMASARTAPAAVDARRCLLPGTKVLTRCYGEINAADLGTGAQLHGQSTPTVHVRRFLPQRSRDVIAVSFMCKEGADVPENGIKLTASHVLAVRRPSCPTFKPTLASEIRVGDFLRTPSAEVCVQQVGRSVEQTEVIEIELEDVQSTMYIARDGSPVEAYGALTPPLRNHEDASILTFNRFDNFWEALMVNEELAACRSALTRAGFNADLGLYGLGPSKMLVRADMAESVLQALHLRSRRLKCSDVVVSREFKPIVEFAVSQSSRRNIFVQRQEALNLQRANVKRTFVEVPSSSSSESAVTRSTTDAHLGFGRNPRKRAR